MSTATQEMETPETSEQAPDTRKPESYVRDALRKYGSKFDDLNPEQRERAVTAHTEKPGLRGQAAARWIVEGLDGSQQVEEARKDREVQKAAETHENRSDAAKKNGSKPPRKPSKYSDDVRAAVKMAATIRGKSHGAGPKQHVQIRKVTTAALKEADQEVTANAIVKLAGAKSLKHLKSIADGSAPREDLSKLRDLGAKMGDDPWCKGRHLAAALAAWAQQLQQEKA